MGAATPDLLSIYNERLRIKKHHLQGLEALPLTPEGETFALGVARHFKADDAFHSSPFFAEETAFINDQLKQNFITQNNQRKFFLAHVLLELVLDKVLINNYPDIIDEYYAHFAVTFPYSPVKRYTETISRHPLPNYEHFLEKFVQGRFLQHYNKADHIVYVLRRVLRRAGVSDPTFLDDAAFPALLGLIEERLNHRYPAAFGHVRQQADAASS